jgi:Helix-turn-helix domain
MTPGAAFEFNPEAFRPLIQQCIEEAMARMEQARAMVGDRLCYSEPEAAAMLGLEPHQLRDERLRGRIKASSIVCRRIRYTREDLMEYLLSRRWTKGLKEGRQPKLLHA